MDLTSIIAQHLLDVHGGDNWTEVNLADTIADVTAKEASIDVRGSLNTIESLLHHITYWNRVMVQRINGVKVEVPESNGFYKMPVLTDVHWREMKADNTASAHELADAIRGVAESRLPEPILPGYSTTYKNLQGSVEHVHYHLGQIVLLKKQVRAM